MSVLSRYPYKLSEMNSPPVSWLFDQLSNKNVSEDGLSLSSSVVVNEQISEMILTLGNNAIFVAFQINAHYNTYARDEAFCHIN